MTLILTQINGTEIRRNFVENLPYNRDLKKYLSEKRKAGILSEVLFWKEFRAGKFHNIDFDRQRIIGNYIVDFYVKTLGLVVEIDHLNDKEECDKNCQLFLESLELKVFRISDFDMKNNRSKVLKDLEQFIILNYRNHPVKN